MIIMQLAVFSNVSDVLGRKMKKKLEYVGPSIGIDHAKMWIKNDKDFRKVLLHFVWQHFG